MVAGRPSPAPLGPVYPAGLALGGGWGLLWPYGNPVCGWGADAVLSPLFCAQLWRHYFAPENMNALHRSSRAEAPSSAVNELLRLLSSRGVEK